MSGSAEHNRFELRRQSDDLVYRFEKAIAVSGGAGFKRSDGDYWIIWHRKLCWIAGIWVIRKGSKPWVYDLVYIETPQARGRGGRENQISNSISRAYPTRIATDFF